MAEAEAADYEAWGDMNVAPGGNAPLPEHGFVGAEKDPAFGLYTFGVRAYDPTMKAFLSPEPDWLSQGPIGLSPYQYAANNPIRLVDRGGRDVAVIENGTTEGNPIGHTAIAVTGRGVYSFGNGSALGSSLNAYVKREAYRRDMVISVIKTSPEQDAAAVASLQSNSHQEGGKVVESSLPMTSGRVPLTDNASTRSSGALDAAGVGRTLTPRNLPGSAGRRAESAGGEQLAVPKVGQGQPPVVKDAAGAETTFEPLNQFEPPKPAPTPGSPPFLPAGEGGRRR